MSRLSADQLRALFAKGILKHSSKGKNGKRGKVIFDKKRDKEIKKMQGKGNAGFTYRKKDGRAAKSSVAASTGARRGLGKRKNTAHNHYTNAARSSPKLSKSGAGLKAAHLRGGGGEKPDHSVTRAARIAQVNAANSRGYLPGQYRDYRRKNANLARSERRKAIGFVERAAYYKQQGNQFGYEAQSKYAQEARQRARDIVAGAKSYAPRISRAEAKAGSLEQKAERQTERAQALRVGRANKTLESILAAQRFTYNGFKGDPKKRYAALKRRERALRQKYGL